MPRKPKPKNELSAGQRAALYLEAQEEKLRSMNADENPEASAPAEAPVKKKKVQKPKPECAVVRVDMSTTVPKSAKLHGICNGPISCGSNLSVLFRDMKIPYIRNTNSDGEFSRYAFDISRIFPDKYADESKPESYNFSLTDKYIMGVYNCGAECIYRFGDSDKGASWAMENPDKWVRVCLYIIKHYNDYWANGFCFGIKHFEICPMGNFSHLDSKSELFSLYEKAAKEIKLADESYLVGGMSFDGCFDKTREFLKFCSQRNVPIDFVSVTAFGDDVISVCETCEKLEATIVNLGLYNTYIMISEWNYIKAPEKIPAKKVIQNEGGEYSKEMKALFDAQKNIEGAAFCSALTVALSGIERVKYACYYDAQPMISPFCGIADRYGNPEKPYYAFCAYSSVAGMDEGVLAISQQSADMSHSGVWVNAGKSGERYKVLISSFDGAPFVDLRLENIPDGVYCADIYMSDGVKNMERCDSVALSGIKKRLLLSTSKFGYVCVEIY